MFRKPVDHLEAYLAQQRKVLQDKALTEKLNAIETQSLSILQWLGKHAELLHHVWTYGIGFALALSVAKWSHGWVNLVIIPVVTVLMGAIVAVSEIFLMLALVTVYTISVVLIAAIWKAWRKWKMR